MAKNRRVMLVGPRSTTEVVSGMRIGFDLLISGLEELQLPHVIINRSLGMSDKIVGTFTVRSIVASLYLFLVYWFTLFRVNTVYITIGISRSGFIRDALMIWSAWILRKRTILHLKGGGFLSLYESSSPRMKWLLEHTFARASIIIVLGNLLVDQFSFVPGISEKLRIVPNGLPKEIQNNSAKPKSLIKSTSIRLLYLSNMIPTKGYLDVLEACRLLKERQIPISCDFCGSFLRTINEGEKHYSEEHFHRLTKQYGLEEIVEFHGNVRGNAKQQLLQRDHLFILPTYYSWEGQPISIIEALALGTPIISTRYRGIPEQVIDAYNGYLIAPKEPAEIADVIEKLWRDPAKYEELSKNALTHFTENFTQEAHLNRLIPILYGTKAE